MRNASHLHPAYRTAERSESELRKLHAARKKWVTGIHPDSLFQRLFDHLPGIFFFAKDRQGRSMFVSRGILDLYHMSTQAEMLGLTDFDINPVFMAETYVADDTRILSGTVKHLERLELWFNKLGTPDWFLVTKLPVINLRGEIDGVMGILRRASENEMQLPVFQTVARAVALMRENFGSPLRMASIAQSCGQSPRQLQRHFQSAFGITPQEFLVRTRVLAAIQLLEETRLSMAEIANRCGFVDSSAFTKHFQIRTGLSPTNYRRSHASALR
jgi:AraC-like DNA-binding protein